MRAEEQDRWKRRISTHAAAALLVFTVLHIACFMAVAGHLHSGWVRYLGIAILVGVVIPVMSRIESRWEALTRQALGPAEIASHFKRERRRLWFAAIAMPFLWTGLLLAGFAFFAG